MIDKLKQDYIDFLRENTEFVKINDNLYHISSPFLGKYNDFIGLYLTIRDEGRKVYNINDDGYFFGLNWQNDVEKENMILNNYGVEIKGVGAYNIDEVDDEYERKWLISQNFYEIGHFARIYHNMIMCCIEISNM